MAEMRKYDDREILSHVDHTLLKPTATAADIDKIIDEGIRYQTASVCIPPSFVAHAAAYAKGRVKICTVIGFPNGYMSTAAKAFEAADAVANGADEIDMVINLSMVKDGCWEDVAEDIKAVRRSCLGKVLKVIIECCLLTDEEKMRMCTIVSECGADFIKTSTGFSKGGATRHDVELLRRCSPDSLQVKAAGGIASLEDAEDFIALGATRLGTSRIVKLAMELERESAGTDTGSENY